MDRRQSGFTLLELMVATTIMGVVLVFVLGTMVSTQKKAASIDDTVEVQQAARQIADIIERDLRHTGMMVADSAAMCGVDNTTAPDRFWVTDWETVIPGVDLDPRLGATLTGAVNLPILGSFFLVDSVVLEESTPAPAYDTDGDNVLDSDFAIGGGVIIADQANPQRGSACGTVTGVTSPNLLRVNLVAGALDPVVVGMLTPSIIAVPAIEYSVNAAGQLFRGPFPLAENVEDLQLAWAVDTDDDNVIDATLGDGISPNYTAQGTSAASLREVRLNVVMRTAQPEPDLSTGNPIATENRAAVAAVNDGFRRRVYTTVVRLRNLGRRIQF